MQQMGGDYPSPLGLVWAVVNKIKEQASHVPLRPSPGQRGQVSYQQGSASSFEEPLILLNRDLTSGGGVDFEHEQSCKIFYNTSSKKLELMNPFL